jgi:tetratricopeptide (TPR) repeat protein/tRNA A-37 threonylcarbamoyl transferase component Bud32
MPMRFDEDNPLNAKPDHLDDWDDEQAIEIVAREHGDAASRFDEQLDLSALAKRGLDLIRCVSASAALRGAGIDSAETPKLFQTPRVVGGDSVSGGKEDHRDPKSQLGADLHTELPARINRFEVFRELGRGGFGVVLLARDPILERMVALKIPRIESFGSRSARQRFEREARAAAMLTHPAIVPLYETQLAGAIQYIVFGYVPGESLAEYLARSETPVSNQLAAKIVSALADAVEHAHQRGVIHRDLKPNNVLIRNSQQLDRLSENEVVKSLCIADFGLAKVAGTDEGLAITRDGAILGTPSYMSPEQATGREDGVGPESDIWSLGAILYELLTGRPPFKAESDLATLRLLEKESPRPPRALNPAVTADLQAICMKCLERRPTDRYSRAGELRADLDRWIEGLPVRARPVSAIGRLWRWTSRNPALAGALTFAFVVLTVGLSVALVQQNLLRKRLIEVTKEKARADEQRVTAQTQTVIADSIRSFLFDDLLNQADDRFQITQIDRARALGLGDLTYVPNPTVNQLVQRVLPALEPAQLEQRFPDQPLAQAELLSTVCRLLTKQGLFASALPLAERAIAQYRFSVGEGDQRTHSAQYLHAVILSGLGKVNESRELQAKVLELRQKSDASEIDIVSSMYAMASTNRRLGNQDEALTGLKQALELELGQHETSHPDVRRAVNVLVHFYLTNGTHQLARQVLTENYPDLGKQLKLDDGSLAVSLEILDSVEYLAECESRSGNAEQAIKLLEQVVSARANLVGDREFGTILSRMHFAKTLTRANRLEESIATHSTLLEEVEREFGTGSKLANACASNLANVYWLIGQFKQAIPIQRELLEQHTEQDGGDSQVTLIYMANLGCSLRDAGEHVEAIELLEKVVNEARTNPALKWASHELIWAYERAGETEKAEKYCRSWLTAFQQVKNPQAYWMSKPLTSLGRLLYNSGNRTEAESVLRKVMDLIDSGKLPNAAKNWTCQESLVLLGACLLDQKKLDDARPLLESGCRNLESNLPPAAFQQNVAACYGHLIRYYEVTDQPELANQWKQKLEGLF